MLAQKIGTLDMQELMRPEPAVSKPTPATEPSRKSQSERDKAESATQAVQVPQPEDEAVISFLEATKDSRPPPQSGTEAIQRQAQERLKELVEQGSIRFDDNLALRFLEDEATGIDYFQIIEKESGDIIRQYPPEEVLTLIEKLREMQGLLVSQEV